MCTHTNIQKGQQEKEEKTKKIINNINIRDKLYTRDLEDSQGKADYHSRGLFIPPEDCKLACLVSLLVNEESAGFLGKYHCSVTKVS